MSTIDQHPETQLYDLREMAKQRGCEVVRECTDKISGAKQQRPGLDQLLADARRHKFDVVLVCALDRMARSVRHFLEMLDASRIRARAFYYLQTSSKHPFGTTALYTICWAFKSLLSRRSLGGVPDGSGWPGTLAGPTSRRPSPTLEVAANRSKDPSLPAHSSPGHPVFLCGLT